MQPNDTTNTHQVTNRNFPSPAHLGRIAPIDASVNPADFTPESVTSPLGLG